MKKTTLILLLLNFTLAVTFGQRGSGQATSVDKSLGYDNTWFTYPGVATDTLGVNDSIWDFTIGVLKDAKHYGDFYLDLDSIGGTATNVNIYIQKKSHDFESFSTVDTITWAATGDTTFRYETASAQSAAFWRVHVVMDSDGFRMKVNRLDGYFVKPD